ncbi:MAG TPA: nitronate monooxygenase family protein [Acetobacteraceae bacterium]|nr:nitronate monooxygenase family protein [Acetobacteraceae bacterium]
MWPDRRLIDLFEIECPLVQAPMAGFATVGLAAAVCEAGGLGSVGCGPMQPQLAATTIQELRKLTSKPINANFFCHPPAKADAGREHAWHDRLAPYYREFGIDHERPPPHSDVAPFGDAMCGIVEDTRPEVVSFHFGLPTPALLARVKAAGCRVMSSATTVGEALWLEARGVDAIIAQGYEAGGHRGTFLAADINCAVASQPGTLALVPQIVDAVSVPVIAAGGIADGRGIAAAFALGAAGTQIGTAYLLCPEAATPSLHRDALRHARGDATVLTNVFTGRPARALVNRLALEVGPITDASSDFPLPMGGLAPLRAKAEQRGSGDFTPFWAGQAAPLATEMSAGALTIKLAKEALERFNWLDGC